MGVEHRPEPIEPWQDGKPSGPPPAHAFAAAGLDPDEADWFATVPDAGELYAVPVAADQALASWQRAMAGHATTGYAPLLIDPEIGEDVYEIFDDAGTATIAARLADARTADIEATITRLETDVPSWLRRDDSTQRPGDPPIDLQAEANAAGYLALIRTAEPWLTPLYLGWSGCVNVVEFDHITPVMRRWQQYFGAQWLRVGWAQLTAWVEHPPADQQIAVQVAFEHRLICPDVVESAGSLRVRSDTVRNSIWDFWWD